MQPLPGAAVFGEDDDELLVPAAPGPDHGRKTAPVGQSEMPRLKREMSGGV